MDLKEKLYRVKINDEETYVMTNSIEHFITRRMLNLKESGEWRISFEIINYVEYSTTKN